MNKRVCVFVDGENFRYAIVNLLDTFKQEDYLPKTASWDTFFDWLTKKASSDSDERVRTYWYVIEHMDFSPHRLPNAYTETEKLKNALSKDQSIRNEIDSLEGDELKEKMKEKVDKLHRIENSMRRRKEGWTHVQNTISSMYSSIDFRISGSIKYDLFRCKLGREKALDVKLAIDLIMLKDIYDVAIIVSGDQDYVPAVRQIKDFGKRAVNVVFETRGGKMLPGGAWRLNAATDDSIVVGYRDFSSFMNQK